MLFERLLAKRYIIQQKRHSLLTICSIVIAIGLMTSLLLSFDTVFKCLRNAEYSRNPYHLLVRNVTQDQASSIYNDPMVRDVKLRQDRITKKFNAMVEFDEDIGAETQFLMDFNNKYSLGIKPDDMAELYSRLEYNDLLMMYDGIGDTAMRTRLTIYCLFFIFVIFVVLALRLIIDTAFEVSSKERERQFGVLQSIGATPKQTANIITWEGLMLSTVGLPLGLLLGIITGFIAFKTVLTTGVADEFFAKNSNASEIIHFYISPLMLAASAVMGLIWVMLSAYGTGMRILKMSPLEAINNRSNKVKKIKKRSVYGLIFGWTGKLASRYSNRQRKRFIITVLSLTISITMFASVTIIMDSIDQFVSEIYVVDKFGNVNTDLILDRISKDNTDIQTIEKNINTLKDTGYFSSVSYSQVAMGSMDNSSVRIYYFNEDKYNAVFKDKQPMPYDELTEKGVILLRRTGNEAYDYFMEPETIDEPENVSSVEVNVMKTVVVTDEEYEKLSEEERKGIKRQYMAYSTEDNPWIKNELTLHSYKIAAEAKLEGAYDNMNGSDVLLIGTMDQFINSDHEFSMSVYSNSLSECVLADPTYHSEAVSFLKDNDSFEILIDMFDMHMKVHYTVAAIKVGAIFFIIMISLISIVNMVNIVSTGIINRRSEIAAMQCAGMTEGQLYRMITIESLQFVLAAAISSVILSLLLVYGTSAFLQALELSDSKGLAGGRYFSILAMIVRILLASLAALGIAVATEVIPLRSMQRRSLVEQIKSVE